MFPDHSLSLASCIWVSNALFLSGCTPGMDSAFRKSFHSCIPCSHNLFSLALPIPSKKRNVFFITLLAGCWGFYAFLKRSATTNVFHEVIGASTFERVGSHYIEYSGWRFLYMKSIDGYYFFFFPVRAHTAYEGCISGRPSLTAAHDAWSSIDHCSDLWDGANFLVGLAWSKNNIPMLDVLRFSDLDPWTSNPDVEPFCFEGQMGCIPAPIDSKKTCGRMIALCGALEIIRGNTESLDDFFSLGHQRLERRDNPAHFLYPSTVHNDGIPALPDQ